MSERPTEPGLWTREGKFYRVWHDGRHDRIQHLDDHNGFSGDHLYLDHENTPTGNWRKLTAEPSGLGADRRKVCTCTGTCRGKDGLGEGWRCALEVMPPDPISNPAVYSNATAVDLESGTFDFEPSKEWFAEHGFEYDDEMGAWANYFPTVNGKKWPVMYLDDGYWQIGTTPLHWNAAATPSPPEVIEGKGQEVTKETAGRWIREDCSTGKVELHKYGTSNDFYLDDFLVFHAGYRYMRCPTFPPRAAFTAPPKPELVLVRNRNNGALSWIAKGEKTIFGLVEIIDPTTGEPIAGERE